MKPDQETDRLLGSGTPVQKDVARVKSPDCRRLLHKTGSSAEDSSGLNIFHYSHTIYKSFIVWRKCGGLADSGIKL